MDILRDLAVCKNLDIIGIAETFLNNEVLQSEINIEGYKIYRKDRCNIKEGKGGGVILYIKDDILSYECYDFNKNNSESVWCKCGINKNKNGEIIIGVCYKSQVASDQELEELFTVIQNASKGQVLIMGDFNYPNIDWNTLESDQNGVAFRDLILDNYLFQHVKVPTRDKNVLDLVITSDENMIGKIEVLEHLGNSDHNIIVWRLNCNMPFEKNKGKFRQFYKADYNGMREWLKGINWVIEFADLNVHDVWQRFCSIIDSAISKFVPLGHVKSKKYPRWMNRAAKSARHYKSKMWIRYRESKTYNDYVHCV